MTADTLTRTNLHDPVRWDDPACRGYNPEWWFADLPQPRTTGSAKKAQSKRDIAAAKAICGWCEIRQLCLDFALERREVGIWGGLTTKEREPGRDLR